VSDCQQYLDDNLGSRYAYVFIALMSSALINMNQLDVATEKLKLLENVALPRQHAAWLRYTKAYISYRKKDYPSAINYLQEVLKDYRDYESIGEATSLLGRIKHEAN